MPAPNYSSLSPPPCPVCGSPTAYKTSRRDPLRDLVTCEYRCTACAVLYPVVVRVTSDGSIIVPEINKPGPR